jgi:hypothetical protein
MRLWLKQRMMSLKASWAVNFQGERRSAIEVFDISMSFYILRIFRAGDVYIYINI